VTTKVDLDDIVTAVDIARRLEVSKQRVHKLAERPDFPPPLRRIGNYDVWSWKAVEAWNQRRLAPKVDA
jgi:predicted DNA-binding transcriptional regulator AlpA